MCRAVLFQLLSVSCLAVSCISPQTEPSVPQAPVIANQYSESAQAIETKVGDEFSIFLDANPSTGHTWQADFDSDLLQLVASEFRQAAAPRGMVGVGGEQRFTFRGLKAGTTDVTFIYKRPWEQEVAKRIVFTVYIKE